MKDMEHMQYSWTIKRPLILWRLLSKLKGYGVKGQLLQWIENFLTKQKMSHIKWLCSRMD